MLLGSVSAMRTTLKNNSRKKEKKHFIKTGVHSVSKNKLTDKKASPEQIALIRKKIKKGKRRNFIIGIIISIVFILIFILVYKFLAKF